MILFRFCFLFLLLFSDNPGVDIKGIVYAGKAKSMDLVILLPYTLKVTLLQGFSLML